MVRHQLRGTQQMSLNSGFLLTDQEQMNNLKQKVFLILSSAFSHMKCALFKDSFQSV